MPTFLRKNAKTGAVHMPVPDWNSPLLNHCLSIAVVIGDRPARFDKYQTTPTFLDVINTGGGITREVSPRAARLGYRTNGTTADRVSLGSITNNDVWSFYGQTEVSVISSIEWDNLPGSILPRIVDKSSSTGVNNGWTLFFWDTTPKSVRFAMNDGTLRILTANSGDWVSPNIRVVGASLSGIPVSGTATASMQIYENGARAGSTSGTLSPFPATTTNAAVGNSPAGSRSADGHTNYVAIFDKALTDAEHLAWAQDEFAWIDKSSTRSQIYIPASTSPPSTSTFFLKTNAKTGAHAPQEVTSIDWQHPMLLHCTSIVVNLGPNPVRFDRDNGSPQQPIVDNSSGDVTTERNSVTGTLSKRFSGDASNDRVSLGSITSDDPWSFFGQTSASVVCHVKRDGFGNSTFPRFVDKSNGSGAANGWGIWWRNQTTDAIAFDINASSGSAPSVAWPTENITNVFGFNISGVPLSGGKVSVTLKAFADGALAGTGSGSLGPFPATTVNAAIGNWNHTSDRMFDGFIDYVAIFDRAIPASQHAMFGETPFAFMQTSERTYFLPATTSLSSGIEHLGQGHFSSSHFAPKHLSSSSAPTPIDFKLTMII